MSHSLPQATAIGYSFLCTGLVLFSGICSGLTLGLLSLDRVDLEVLKRSGSDLEKKYAGGVLPVRRRSKQLGGRSKTLAFCSSGRRPMACRLTFYAALRDLRASYSAACKTRAQTSGDAAADERCSYGACRATLCCFSPMGRPLLASLSTRVRRKWEFAERSCRRHFQFF